MPSSAKSLTGSRVVGSDLRDLTLMAEDGDDDLRNLSEPSSIDQNLMFSAVGNPRYRSLEPSNGIFPKKRPRSAASAGKENRPITKCPEFDSTISDISPEERKVVEAGRGNPATSICDRYMSAGFEKMEENKVGKSCLWTSIESEHFGRNHDSEYRIRGEKSFCWASTAPKATENEGTRDSELKIPNDKYYLMSIESRLLKLKAQSGSSENEHSCSQSDDGEYFEAGTQLNELMNLCSEVDAKGDLNVKASELDGNELLVEISELQWSDRIECPLCGDDISELSEELRQVHTNNCLDNCGTVEVTHSDRETKSTSPQENVGISSVLEFLRNLGLSRYEEVFVREEIDWESLQWLTEEDLLNIGIAALGPRKKIVCALSELRKLNDCIQETNTSSSNLANKETAKLSNGNKLITEYFRGSVNKNVRSLQKPPDEKGQKVSASKRASNKKSVSKVETRDIPLWCCIPGTPFRVDAFRFLRGDCSHWFLTHFHIDHYQGLTRHFCRGKIYCSSITAHLVNLKIGVPWERMQILPLNQKIVIAGVSLTCFDANHCPGSIIILFEPSNSKAVLHTGDFRFSSEMVSNSILKSSHIHTLILDTTYCNPQYDFPKQEAVIQFVIEAIQAEAFNPKTLFLIGSYTIGKERLFLEVARLLQKKVYVGSAKLRLLRCLELPEEDMQWFTANEMESHIHVVPMWTLASFKRMKYISNQYADRFDLIVAFSPTGWTFGKGKKRTPGRRWQQGTIIRYEVPYSEHCSFTELREFVQFISPEHIIPSVNNNGPESADAMLSLLVSDP
ncbi:uncharacterized protein [Typha latifolia]|uniref:uncharacterized protein isoform X1 n=1 Tax=Typha latifolia TaxID=4733 RepID=UPI003C2DE8D0